MISVFLSIQKYAKVGVIIALALVVIEGCQSSAKKAKNGSAKVNKLVSAHPSDEVHARYAEGFSVRYFDEYKLINIFNAFTNQSDTLRYLLVPQGGDRPEGYPNAQVIEVPIQQIIVTGVTHVAFLDMVDALDVIQGIVGAKYVYNSKVRQQLKTDKITAFAPNTFGMEKIIAMDPDLVMIAGGQVANFNDYRLLMEVGIPVFVNADWLETTPLGRAEWIKVMAALLNKESLANKRFGKVAQQYNKLKTIVNENISMEEKPLIINNLPYKSAWFVSGGGSYKAQLFEDAGAAYPWYNSDETGGLKLDFEAVYAKGLKADIWLNPGRAQSIQEIIAKDARFKDFKSVKTGQVYNKIKRITSTGANDYWETGVVRPDLVLHDLINIFHPGLLKSDSLYFYQKLN